MSLRIDTSDLIPGAYVVGETGLGVLAENIPSGGLYGASFLFNDVDLPADNGKEIRGLIVTPPSDGQFFAWEDGSFSLVGAADGEYTFVYRLYVDGVDGGTATANITIGEVDSELSGDATLGSIAASGALGVLNPSALSGAAALAGITADGALSTTNPSALSGGATLGDASTSGAMLGVVVSIMSGAAVIGGIRTSGRLESSNNSQVYGSGRRHGRDANDELLYDIDPVDQDDGDTMAVMEIISVLAAVGALG